MICIVILCRSSSSEKENEAEFLSYAMDIGETPVVEDSSDIEFSEDTTADDGNAHVSCIFTTYV